LLLLVAQLQSCAGQYAEEEKQIEEIIRER
jgi:hypothetical protein